ncbi:glutathione transferase GstA [Microvirga arsenatis]|uniref:Glutathione transferase GstA n=1 Tax=Microvirga arsenatis TaxID=2692265 RepID=A0ABW9Z134_9HYPH|nr:glutathione transferase GstA [Microvirga arsenatis]NBJ12520.1 glutathione transferase GstA [Microvirga arsenatis]NBJ26242.1 glutathione transferase GstA [Microvirga arsenatis]
MKLYYYPGACSLAPHIVAREAGIDLSLEKVDLATRTTEAGANYAAINPKGYVPALGLQDGSVLTEAGAIIQYLAHSQPAAGLAPAHGTMEHYRLLEWIGFISTEIHKGFGPLWNPATPDAVKAAAKERLATRFAHLDGSLAKQPFLMGDRFTIADAYLFTVVNWTNFHGIDISPFVNLQAFQARVAARPSVQKALEVEGLLKKAA